MTALLETIDSPLDLRDLNRRQLKTLADELREFLLNSVASTGGHLSSNLGTVELSVAIHHVYQTPFDRLVWDVGHQSYPHKILTGRRQALAGLRQLDCISGFPRRTESDYDALVLRTLQPQFLLPLAWRLGLSKRASIRGPIGADILRLLEMVL